MIRPTLRPKLTLITESFKEVILAEAGRILSELGVYIENEEAYQLLQEHGAVPTVSEAEKRKIGRLKFPERLIETSLSRAPKAITLFDIRGEEPLNLEGDHIHFDPGSAALYIHDPETGTIRKPVTRDLHRFIHLVDSLPHYHLQSTALISSDVPQSLADCYRLFLALKLGNKPIISGIFEKSSFSIMKEMLTLVRNGEENLRQKPLAIFDACPSPPLMWSDLTAQSVIEAARVGIPSEFVSMPLTGSTAPVTLSGAIVQHTAETLSGVVLAQCANAGAPVIWGGSPSAMDLRFGTTPMGAIETMMIDIADVSIGKYLRLPTHAYMGLSDSKRVDYQAGQESGTGIILAALAGINVVSGPGMMDFESCQSLEKLVLDHEICSMAYRLLNGVTQRDEIMALDLLSSLSEGDHLLTHPHTLKWFKEELHFPGKSVDRRARGSDKLEELPTAEIRAHQEVERILSEKREPVLDEAILRELNRIMAGELKKAGMEKLP